MSQIIQMESAACFLKTLIANCNLQFDINEKEKERQRQREGNISNGYNVVMML